MLAENNITISKYELFLYDRRYNSALYKNYFTRYVKPKLKMIAFWDIAPCSLVEVDRRFRGAYCLRHCPDGDYFNPEGCNLHTRRRENLKSHRIV
jgi:hypothetical protein